MCKRDMRADAQKRLRAMLQKRYEPSVQDALQQMWIKSEQSDVRKPPERSLQKETPATCKREGEREVAAKESEREMGSRARDEMCKRDTVKCANEREMCLRVSSHMCNRVSLDVQKSEMRMCTRP